MAPGALHVTVGVPLPTVMVNGAVVVYNTQLKASVLGVDSTLLADAGPVHPEDFADLWGLGLFAIASVVSLGLLMWRRRASGDALAMGTLWAGVAIHGLPRVVGPGTSFSEIVIAGYGVSIGDIALAWAGLWLTWRLLASRS